MQIKKVLLFAAVAASKAASTESLAHLWLQTHQGNPDELSDLKDQNPDAYALVKALLMKKSLGLLNNHHPTASFAAAPQQEQPHGAEAYAQFQTPHASGGSQNWMNWKPKDSAADDETMVKSVLGAVANLAQSKGIAMKLPAAHSDSPLENEEASFAMTDTAATTAAPHQVSAEEEAQEAQQRAALAWHDDAAVMPLVASPTKSMPDFSAHVATSWSEPAPTPHRAPLAYSEDEEARQRAALAGTGGFVSSAAPARQSSGGGWMNWKPRTGSDDEQMVNSVLGAVAGLTKSSQGQAAFLRKAPAPSGNALLDDAANMEATAVRSTPDIEPVARSAPPTAEQGERGPTASLASVSSPLHMHHHTSHFWSDEKSAPQPSASPIVDQPAAPSSWQQFSTPAADNNPKPVALNMNSAAVSKPQERRSATDNMVQKMLDAVANVATGKNREILLRRKAHLSGTMVDSNPLVDAAESLGVQPMDAVAKPAQVASSAVTAEEAKERDASAWHDDGSWTPPVASAPLPTKHRVAGNWAADVMPANLGAVPVANAPTAKHADVSLWSTIGRTAQMFGVNTESSAQAASQPEQPAQPAPQAHHSLMAEFLKHSRNAQRHGHASQETKKTSVSESLLKDETLFNDDDSEKDTAQSVAQAQEQAAQTKASGEDAAEARLAVRAASRSKTALSRFVDKASPEAVDKLAEVHSSSPLDAFSFEDTTPAPKRSVVASAGDQTPMSHNLASWLGFSSQVTQAQAPAQKQEVRRSSGNNYMDDLWR